MHIDADGVKPGDVIEVEGKHVGEPGRMGRILEVLGTSDAPHFRVLWEDEHESIFYPAEDARLRLGPER